MKVKHLKKDEMRVICLEENALVEFLAEVVIENAKNYFSLLDSTTVSFQMTFQPENKRFICAIVDNKDRRNFDLSQVANEIGATTDSMFSKRPYETVNASKYEKLI